MLFNLSQLSKIILIAEKADFRKGVFGLNYFLYYFNFIIDI